jgi:DNA-binding protein HU-beta
MEEKIHKKRGPSLNLGHLATVLQNTVGGTLGQARLGARAIFDEILRATLAGEAVSIQKFGRFEGAIRKARVGRNPHTGELLELPSKRVLVFRRARIALTQSTMDEPKGKRSKKK